MALMPQETKSALNIVLAVDSYPPVTKAGGIQMRDLATMLARLGHRVTVLTPDPKISAIRVETDNGVTVARCPSGRTKGIALALRAINEFVLPARLWRAFRNVPEAAGGVDLFIWYSPTIFLGPLAFAMRWRRGTATYLILRDIFPDWAVEAGVMRKGLAYRGFKAFEWLQYKAADVIGVQTDNNLRYFEGRKPKARIEVLHNWRDLEPPAAPSADILASYDITQQHVLVFGGTLGVAQDMDNLLRLAKRLLDRPDVAILFVGEGSEKRRIKDEVAARALVNVKIVDGLSETAFESLLTVCLGGLISLDRRLTSHNVPGKLLSYLKAGLPVLASVNPGNDLIEIINDAEAGQAVINGDDAGLAAAALRLCDEPGLRATWAENALTLAHRTFSAHAAASQVIEAAAPIVRTRQRQ